MKPTPRHKLNQRQFRKAGMRTARGDRLLSTVINVECLDPFAALNLLEAGYSPAGLRGWAAVVPNSDPGFHRGG
jgi:hypothetical protein